MIVINGKSYKIYSWELESALRKAYPNGIPRNVYTMIENEVRKVVEEDIRGFINSGRLKKIIEECTRRLVPLTLSNNPDVRVSYFPVKLYEYPAKTLSIHVVNSLFKEVILNYNIDKISSFNNILRDVKNMKLVLKSGLKIIN